ncbi:hypothetical protein ANTPLA_LOCUS9198 [Anthophora plagiata]
MRCQWWCKIVIPGRKCQLRAQKVKLNETKNYFASKQRTRGAFITYRPCRWGVCYARFLEITFQADNYW